VRPQQYEQQQYGDRILQDIAAEVSELAYLDDA
jgi:hypothetical protein